ncbi:MAG TPA: hypothetical protein VER33_17245 [Polyangiaceae bacterium]|nr:hypothetical protein [Polyangiaceae bacterium]
MTRALIVSTVLTGLVAAGCGASSSAGRQASSLQEVAGVPSDDRSRCDFRGRADREVSESTGASATFPNVRRVYGIVGEGEDRRRVLLCREVDTNLDGAKDVVRTFNDRGEPLSELADSNYDGKVDTWIAFTRGRVSKMQVDNSGSGQADETRFYVGGKLSRAQRDTNRDGRPDVWEIYDEGSLQRVGVDLNFDSHVDRWDRDEMALRALAERERDENDARAPESTGPAAAPAEGSDAAPAEGHVSPRRR